MAADLVLRILADPLHATILLQSAPGSGFDRDPYQEMLADSASEDAREIAAREDAALADSLTKAREVASASIEALSNTHIIHDLPRIRSMSPFLRALAMTRSVKIEPAEHQRDVAYPADTLNHRAFVLDAHSRAMLLAHAELAGADLDAVVELIDANLGQVAILIED